MGGTPDTTPRVPSSPPSAAPPSPPASASPSLPARVPMRSSDEGLDVDMTAPPSVPDSPPDASALDDGSIPPPAVPDSPSEDESMEPPQAPAAASLPRVDPRPTMADVLSHKNFSAAITPKLKLRAVAWRPRSLSPVTSKRLNVSTPLVATGRSLRLAWSKRVRMRCRVPDTTWY
ncbi:hypothetical protein GQ600_7348 [Phytophthora cactorum]|nr:hypothetical protein GQ600_7348 [Phytophthora cactorum]